MTYDCQIQTVDDSSVTLAIDHCAQMFAAAEPVTDAIGLTCEQIRATLAYDQRRFVSSRMSQVAIDANNKVAGVLLADDYAEHCTRDLYRPANKVIFSLLQDLNHIYQMRFRPSLKEGVTVHIAYLAVAPEHHRSGIGEALVRAALQCARNQAYQKALVESSSLGSQALFIGKLGFTECAQIVYRNYRFGGQRPFVNVSCTNEIVLSILKL
ncbi:Uncharacterised protein [BD1-7 clade bacterium]|uniref:N-acetyltransferase domain-containing protein n=1 Tax=BD1-7 clade bacterium TaxID=2029982 RepID=A0A5S9QFA5_9GAMM|nr:Uncharacterised protein [BD1-7 clade bacterium]CAA0117203.1 Uncharacterised protein [BD1-7 clade bacterium]